MVAAQSEVRLGLAGGRRSYTPGKASEQGSNETRMQRACDKGVRFRGG